MINGVLLDSIGLALFSLAWWGWLIGGGLAVVGMLFGVHVAVGAPEAQAYSSSDSATADALSQGDIGAAAQIQAQSQPGYSGPASDPFQKSYEQQLYDSASQGDISAAVKIQQLEQQKWLNTPHAGPEVRQLTEQEIAERDAKAAAEAAQRAESDAAWDAYLGPIGMSIDDYFANPEAAEAKWAALAGSGAGGGSAPSGGGGAPVAPASPSGGVASAAGSNPWMADPYYDVESEWASDLRSTYFQSGDNGARLDADQEAAKRHYDSDKPLVMNVGSWDSQTFTDRSYALVSSEGVLDEAGAKALADDLVNGEIARAGSAEAALVLAKDFNSIYQTFFESYQESGDLSFTERNDVHEYMAKAAVSKYLIAELEQAVIEEAAPPPAPTVAFKAKGAQVDPTYTPSDDGGTLDIAMKAKARAGSTVKIQVMEYNADKGRMVVVDTTKAKVGKGGKIHTAVEADAGDVVMVKKNTGKKLAQIEIPGQ